MKLIIDEKPALVSAIADALDGPRKSLQGSTYMTVGDYTLISVFGHLLELKEPEDYDECYKDRKNISLLPIYFDDWGLKVKEPDAKHKDSPPEERLNEIGRLLKQCEYVIHAGDPDEEGQLLIDEVLRWFHYKGKAYRLDTLDLTEAGMRRALKSLTDNRLHENSGWSAYARSVADAIVGFNLSRYFSALNGVNLPVGRVQTATLGLVCARDEQIESHKKTLYYDVTAVLDVNGARIDTQYTPAKDDANLTDGRMLSRTYAQSRADMLKDETLNGVTVTRKTVSEDAPLPFNLGKLTSFCGSKFGYKPQEVMEITQSLREKYKAISYNRTDCQYLTETQYAESGPTMDAVIRNIGFRPKQLDMTLKSKCFNDKYTMDSGEAHTAIIPQNISVDIHAMTEPERKVYLAICQYYMAQFMPPAKKERSALTVKLKDGGTLSASASKIIEMGYLTLFKKDGIRNEESALCAVPVGTYQCDVLDASVAEKETKPPVRYTQNTLVADMSCIAKYVEDNEVKALLKEKDKGKQGENGSIGTPATRAAIVVGLVNHGYLEDDGKRVISTPKAREFYRILPDEVKKADMTAYWWVMQEDVRTGKDDYHILTNSVLETVRTIVHTKYPLLSEELRSQLAVASGRGQILGVCPRCGSAVIEGKRGFGCSGYKQGCKFIIWKTQKTSLMKDCVITAANVKAWLSEPWVSLPDGKKKSGKSVKLKKLTSKAGNHFESELFLLDDASSEYGPGFVFPEQDEKEVLGRCPRCGGDVTEFPSGFSCSGHENGCGFVIWKKSKLKMLSKTTFTAKDVRAFLLGQSVRKTTLLKKNGTKFTASLVMQDDPNSPYGPNFTFGEGLDR